jgi:hypothetical protein
VAEEGKLLTSYTPGRDETFIWPADIFRVAGQKSGKAVTLRPLYEVGAERGYVVYWDTCAPGEWPAREAATVGGDSGRR